MSIERIENKDLETEEEFLQDLTLPKLKSLNKEVFDFHKEFIEAITQDLTTCYLEDREKEIVDELLYANSQLITFYELTRKDIRAGQRLIARFISNYVNSSKGAKGNLLKLLRSTYTVSEIRKNEPTPEEKQKLSQIQQYYPPNQAGAYV